ncbi:type VI secretion system Vgr family protein [Marinomonas posidonica]|uniref:Type VI secretion system Vgr family protein n=1 Tax=Marinomonas posidonica (strain CECT 7376 / NCIMB 14433 / IVIA-Po-181) TaxID=491952 RepID=F6CWU8_MARPP|nr:type VI secretion system tip protein TssI/VgrG [Marinomonas posidonica]AEF55510.1 type VI secretion system Vgr family protein [Marinomonas posidonica IVIA-Po-181]
MATLMFKLAVDGLDENTLLVREYRGQDSLSDSTLDDGTTCYGFRYQLSLASRRMDLSADTIVDKQAELTVWRDGELVHRVHGIVRHFEKGDTGHNYTFYGLTLVPALERLSLRHNSRIFQKQSAKDILTQLITDMDMPAPVFTLENEEPKEREFCVQYRETDADFLHRLAAEEGWVYYFSHEAGKHTLHFIDKSQALAVQNDAIAYNLLTAGVSETPYINALSEHKQSLPSQSTLKDYSFKQPGYAALNQHTGTNLEHQLSLYEHFDAPGRFKDNATGQRFARIRLEYLRRRAHLLTGDSDASAILVGRKIRIAGHFDASIQDNSWIPVQVEHHGTQPQVLEEEGGEGQTSYQNHFTLIPGQVNWQATPQPQPSVDGPMMATVVGPAANDGDTPEEIYCDEHGRVKIQFAWDRYGQKDDFSSCWVQVSQSWAGSQYGTIALPRIGTDVIVSFLNGDPDQPIITGRTYNADNLPPYALPANKTKTVWRSQTHQGAGFNEISFEDQVGQEQVYLHAQKDLQTDVLHDQTTSIGNDQHLSVVNDSFSEVKNNQHITVKGERRSKVTLDQTHIVEGSLQQQVGEIAVTEAGEDIQLQSGDLTVVEAGAELTVKVGGSFITINADGVYLVGPEVNIGSETYEADELEDMITSSDFSFSG